MISLRQEVSNGIILTIHSLLFEFLFVEFLQSRSKMCRISAPFLTLIGVVPI